MKNHFGLFGLVATISSFVRFTLCSFSSYKTLTDTDLPLKIHSDKWKF